MNILIASVRDYFVTLSGFFFFFLSRWFTFGVFLFSFFLFAFRLTRILPVHFEFPTNTSNYGEQTLIKFVDLQKEKKKENQFEILNELAT